MLLNYLKTKVKGSLYSCFLTLDQARKVTPKAYIESLSVELAKHCNLHCYSCDHFSQLSKSGYYDINKFEKDIIKLSEITSGLVGRFSLMGGEPLLNKQCADYCAIVRKFFPNSEIHIVTNGKLLLKQPAVFWQGIRENTVTIRATKYPINIDWNAIKEKCREEQVLFMFYNNDEREEKQSFKTKLDKNGLGDPFENFIHCHRANSCTHFYDGRIYPCAVAGNIQVFNQAFSQNLQQHKMDYIDIHEDGMLYDKILQFLAKPIPFCRYCKTKNVSYRPWTQSQRTIDEYYD